LARHRCRVHIDAAKLSTQVDIPDLEFTQARELARLAALATNSAGCTSVQPK
jgi:hypothetical protein